MRWIMLALVVTLVPASSHAGVFISVGFAPPVLPVYEQPVCPAPNLMWTPGYWAYSYDTEDYYWVPGAWVPAPYEGALWTPGYWGWSGGLFVFHEGYWGPHVGYYGGVNYGFGYGGIGFAGGEWRGGVFAYNTAVVRVDERFVHTTFVDRERVDRGFVARGNRVAFSGGPGGINHPPSSEERMAEHDQHVAKTSFQAQHESVAKADRSSFAKSNGGRPRNLAVATPLAEERHNPAPAAAARPMAQAARPMAQAARPMAQAARPMAQSAPARQAPSARPAPAARPAPSAKPAPKPKEERENR